MAVMAVMDKPVVMVAMVEKHLAVLLVQIVVPVMVELPVMVVMVVVEETVETVEAVIRLLYNITAEALCLLHQCQKVVKVV
jgi:hypothetical protein